MSLPSLVRRKEKNMQQELSLIPTSGVAVPTANGYEVPEGRGEVLNRNSLLLLMGQSISLIGDVSTS